MDPVGAARHWRGRRQAREAARQARQGSVDAARVFDDGAEVPESGLPTTVAEVLASLPEATGDDIGRIVHVRSDTAVDTLNIGVSQPDGTVTWVPLNVDIPDSTLRFAPVRTLGSSGTGAGQFSYPSGVAVDGAGNVFVADTGNNRVQRWNGASWTRLPASGVTSGSGNGQFNLPAGIAVDVNSATPNVLVADTSNNRVQVLTNAIAYSAQFGSAGTGNGEFASPRVVAVGADGKRYVADTGNNRVQVFTSGNSYSSKFGTLGSGNGQFNRPSGIAVAPDGSIWVADLYGNRVQKFDSTGTFLLSVGSYGSGAGQFNAPRGVACDRSGNVYVADTNNHRVQVFDSTGLLLTLFGSYGNGEAQFKSPGGVTVDPFGVVYVADQENHRISVWTLAGSTTLSSYTQFDDFNGGGTSTGTVGELGWATAGDGSLTIQSSTAAHAGIVRLGTGGTSGNTRSLSFGPFLVDQVAEVQLLVNAANSTSIQYRVGLMDSLTSTAPGEGAWAEFDTNASDTAWMAVQPTAGTPRTSTGVTFATSTWYRVTVAWTGSGAAELRVRRMDTGQQGVVALSGVSTTAQLYVAFVARTRTGTARTLDVDAALLTTQGITRV